MSCSDLEATGTVPYTTSVVRAFETVKCGVRATMTSVVSGSVSTGTGGI